MGKKAPKSRAKSKSRPNGDIHDCAIVGAGPAGLLSALYLRRFRRSVLVFGAGKPRAAWIPRIHNLIGVERPTSGRRILKNLERQLRQLDTSVIREEVRVERARGFFRLRAGKTEWRARRVLLATGVTDRSPDLTNLESLRKSGLLGYCPICDGYEHCDQRVGLIAENSRSLSKIPFLCGYTRRIHVISAKPFKIAPVHQALIRNRGVRVRRERVTAIELIGGTRGKTKPRGLRVRFRRGRPLELDFAYVSMGVRINDAAFAHLKSLKRTKEGYLRVDSLQRTSVPGLYAAGDCVNDLFQVSVAAGHAAIAATDMHNSLDF